MLAQLIPVRVACWTLLVGALGAAALQGCGEKPAIAPPPSAPAVLAPPAVSSTAVSPTAVSPTAVSPSHAAPAVLAQSSCSAADWTPRSLAPLLSAGKGAPCPRPDRSGSFQRLFSAECSDSPAGPGAAEAAPVVLDGVELRVASATPAGASGRGWRGNQCAFEVRLADGSGKAALLGPADVPPFNTLNALVRSGSAVWLSVGFNGYAREFPKGGNHILALDLCQGRVVWRSSAATSNGGLLLLDDYLVSAYGFTGEARSVFVFDARSGKPIQQLPVVENICPSKDWAPHWHPGERCDAPGQRVGAATNPRLEAGSFLVDTNTGSSAFVCR